MPSTPRDTESRYRRAIDTHNQAFAHPYQGFEDAIAHLVKGLIAYRNAYVVRYHVEISADPALREDWLMIARGIIGLLDGDTGTRLSCAALDGLIRSTAESAGFTLSLESVP